jgi:Skp family chaperone for outer membrane proteins
VKSLSRAAAAVACLSALALSAGSASAQGTAGTAAAPRRPDNGIRVIDIERAFKEHARYNAQIERLKETAKQMEAETNKAKQDIINMEKDLPTHRAGTPERTAMEEKVLKAKTELAARARMKQQELLEQEAKIYYFTYKEIQDEVAEYCRQTGVSLVLQYSSEKVDPANRMSIMKAMGNPVVHHTGIDITETLLKYINGNQPPAANNGKRADQAQQPDFGDIPRRK